MKHALILSFLALASTAPALSHACSCAPPGSLRDDFRETPLVALVEVQSKAAVDLDPSDEYPEPSDYLYGVRVIEGFKGIRQGAAQVTSAIESAACGFEMEPGQRYVLWMYQPGEGTPSKAPVVSLCSRSKHASKAGSELRWLGRHRRP